MRMRVSGGLAGPAVIIAVALPALEMLGIYLVSRQIGWGWTLAWLVADVWLGLRLIRSPQGDLAARLRQTMERGEHPLGEIWASGRRLLAGVLLIVPGPGSDLLALLLLLWPARRQPLPPPSATPPGEARIIEGEFRREE